MAKAVAYYRVSTQKQGVSGLGMDAQRQAVAAFLATRPFDLVEEFVEVESGKGKDALNKRGALRAALDCCKRCNATLIIAKLDRLSRNVHFVSGLMESRVKFIACDMPDANQLTIHIMAAVAEQEAKRISQRTKDALQVAKLRGVLLGRAGPANLKPNLVERQAKAREHAEKLRRVLEPWRLAGLSQRQMVAELNAMRIEAARGGPCWTLSQLQRVLAILDVGAQDRLEKSRVAQGWGTF